MEPDIKVSCLDCSKYRDGDVWGALLALACQAVYLSFFFQAVVLYVRRDALDFCLFGGAVVNAGLSKILKSIFRQPRPSAKCAILGVCDSYGLPSTHAQVLAFTLAAYAVLITSLPHKSKPALGSILRTLETAGLLGLTASVSYARVYLGYHNWEQVTAGTLAGLSCGCIWTYFTVRVLSKLRSGPVQFLGLTAVGLRNDRSHQHAVSKQKRK